MGGVADFITGGGGDAAAQASVDASNIQAQAQREALEYLKQRERYPQYYREQALNQLADIYGIAPPMAPTATAPAPAAAQAPAGPVEPGQGGIFTTAMQGYFPPAGQPAPGAAGTQGLVPSVEYEGGGQQRLIDQAMASPLYQAIMGSQGLGEESIMRQASATGGLRSGNVQENLYDYNTRLGNQALLETYNQQLQGIQGLANLPSNATQIAGAMVAPAQTQAQGLVAGAQAEQMANQSFMQGLFGLGGAALAGGMFSDIRAKKDIEYLGTKNGHNIYAWTWNDLGETLGLCGRVSGVLAHEVYETNPEAIHTEDGLLLVDYAQLGLVENEVAHG